MVQIHLLNVSVFSKHKPVIVSFHLTISYMYVVLNIDYSNWRGSDSSVSSLCGKCAR